MANSNTNDPKKKKSADPDWDFTNVTDLHINNETVVQPRTTTNFVEQYEKKLANENRPLILDEAAVPRTKTRSAMALEMSGGEQAKTTEEFQAASLILRFLSFILDMAILGAVVVSFKFSATIVRKVLQSFIDHYKLQFLLPEPLVMKMITIICIAIGIFLFVVVPVSFFNGSIGKKVFGIRIRGLDTYSVSIAQAFKREIVMKPISLLLLVGIFMPLFSKSRLSLHDKLARTIVIKAD